MSNSRVESHSRAELRNKIISAATLLEILLSGLVLIGLLLSMVPLLQWMPGLLFDGNDVEVSTFLQRALDIVIGIEFIKMLAKHSPGSSLEVLLYAIARHMVVGHESAMENLLSVSAIALIFIVRRFFFVPAFGAHLPDGHPAPDLSPSQSGIPSEEFAARLRKHLHHDDTDTELEVAIEDPKYEDNTDTLLEAEVKEEPKPMEADELFDDFIFNYASDDALQRQRTVFPLPYYNRDTPSKIEEEFWKHDYLFTKQNYYTLLFDKEEDMDMVGDTTLTSVQVEWIFLKTRMVKRYYFERKRGMWMLEAINLREMEKGENEDFVEFYTRFVTDSVYQSKHIRHPLQFITIDPDDEFSILETTLDVDQWYAFRPVMPTDRLSNINYGQKNEDLSDTKILKVNGIGNGYSNIFYFRKRSKGWELYKYEDTSI